MEAVDDHQEFWDDVSQWSSGGPVPESWTLYHSNAIYRTNANGDLSIVIRFPHEPTAT